MNKLAVRLLLVSLLIYIGSMIYVKVETKNCEKEIQEINVQLEELDRDIKQLSDDIEETKKNIEKVINELPQ